MVICAFGKFSLIHRKAGVAITTSPTQFGERIMILLIFAGFFNEICINKLRVSFHYFYGVISVQILHKYFICCQGKYNYCTVIKTLNHSLALACTFLISTRYRKYAKRFGSIELVNFSVDRVFLYEY